jgi:RNase P protein component
VSARVSCSGLGRLLAGVALVAGLAGTGAGVAPAGERRAGTVLAVDPQARTLVLDEFGANAERRALRVQVPREAVVLVSQRNRAGREVKDSFRDSSITLADVRTGDFVVIEMSDQPEVARLVMITLRRGVGF